MENISLFERGHDGCTDEQSITIIMATFNGGKYLKDQLDSIINQTWKNWKLIVRDDSSSDNTLQILVSYKLKEARIEVLYDEKKNLGTCMNFAELMEYSTFSEYLMFSDQDDIWLPTKIEDTFKAMKVSESQYGKNVPLLVHTDLCIVDENLDLISDSAEKYIKLYPHTHNNLNYLLAQNFVFGCTVMINRALLKDSLPVPTEAECHDYWVSLIAVSLGHIVYLPKSYILYRQHSRNISGGISGGTFVNRIKRITLGWNDINNVIDMRIRQGFALKARVASRLSVKDRNLLINYLSYARCGGLSAVIVAIKNRVSRQGIGRTFIFYLGLLKKRNIENVYQIYPKFTKKIQTAQRKPRP